MDKKHSISLDFHLRHWNMEIVEYYIFQTMYNITSSMLSLFLPIYLLHDVGYPLWAVISYFIINQFFFVLLVPFVGRALHFLKIKQAIVVHLPFVALYFILIRTVSGDFIKDLPLLIFILFFRAAAKSLYAVANDVFMAKHLMKKSSGKMLAWLKIFLLIASIITPLVGGIISYLFGFGMVFIVSSILIILSGIPLLLTPGKHFEIKYGAKDILNFTTHHVKKNYAIAEFGRVLPGTVMWIIWPIFLYFAVKNTAELGTILSISSLISIGMAYYIGKKIDGGSRKKILKRGIALSEIFFFIRTFYINPIFIGAIDALGEIINPMVEIPYNHYAYQMVATHKDQIKMANVKQFVTEFYYFLGTIVLMPIVLIFPELTQRLFIILFSIFAIIRLLMLRMTKIKLEKKVAIDDIEAENEIQGTLS